MYVTNRTRRRIMALRVTPELGEHLHATFDDSPTAVVSHNNGSQRMHDSHTGRLQVVCSSGADQCTFCVNSSALKGQPRIRIIRPDGGTAT